MKYALVKNGIVVNVIESSPEHNDKIKDQYNYIIQDNTVGPGFLYDGVKFTDPRPAYVPEPKTQKEINKDQLKSDLTTFDSMTDTQKIVLIKKIIEVL